jgi:hypothetical protein
MGAQWRHRVAGHQLGSAAAQQQMAALLSQFPQIDGVISDYGSDLAGAIRAFQAAGRELVPMASLEANSLGCAYKDLKASNPKFELTTISSRNWLGRVAVRKALAAANGLENTERPAQLPITGLAGRHGPSATRRYKIAHFSNQRPRDIAQSGVVSKPVCWTLTEP